MKIRKSWSPGTRGGDSGQNKASIFAHYNWVFKPYPESSAQPLALRLRICDVDSLGMVSTLSKMIVGSVGAREGRDVQVHSSRLLRLSELRHSHR